MTEWQAASLQEFPFVFQSCTFEQKGAEETELETQVGSFSGNIVPRYGSAELPLFLKRQRNWGWSSLSPKAWD